MKIHYIQHVPFEDPAYFLTWAAKGGHGVSYTRTYENPKFPVMDDFQCLLIMGGPMNIYENARYPWLKEEKKFIENAIKNGSHVIGICLGAQLIAHVLGARIFKNKYTEIGWFNVHQTDRAGETPFRELPETFKAFHWHGDTFDLPDGAVRCAGSQACENQAFTYGKNVLALQFHIESTRESIAALAHECSEELTEAPFIQGTHELSGGAENFIDDMHRNLDRLLKGFF